MKSIAFLDKTLTYSEYEAAVEIYNGMMERDIDPLKAAAMMYRCGFLDGKSEQRENYRKAREARRAYYASKNIESQPLADNEGDNTNE